MKVFLNRSKKEQHLRTNVYQHKFLEEHFFLSKCCAIYIYSLPKHIMFICLYVPSTHVRESPKCKCFQYLVFLFFPPIAVAVIVEHGMGAFTHMTPGHEEKFRSQSLLLCFPDQNITPLPHAHTTTVYLLHRGAKPCRLPKHWILY